MEETINVVIVEDKETEASKIKQWLGLRDDEVSLFDPTRHVRGGTAYQFEYIWSALRRMLEGSNPRVVILDLGLHESADFNGQGLCREIRKTCPKLGLICVTVMPLVQGVDMYRDWGANYGWAKPWIGGQRVPQPGNEAKLTRNLVEKSLSAKDCCDFS